MSVSNGPIRVLHVDDDENITALSAEYLRREDDRLSVTTADDPEDALDVLEGEPIDCVVTDFKMPGMNGLELLEAVRERRSGLPVILFTGESRDEIDPDPLEAGVTDYLHKGELTDDLPLLAVRIAEAVERRRARRGYRAALDRIEALSGDATEALLVLDPDGRIDLATPGVEALLGHSPADLVGADPAEYVHPDDRDALAFPPDGGVEWIPVELDGDDGWVSAEIRVRDRRDDPAIDGGVVALRRADDTPQE